MIGTEGGKLQGFIEEKEKRGSEDQRENWSNSTQKPSGKSNRWFQRSCPRRSIFTDITEKEGERDGGKMI